MRTPYIPSLSLPLYPFFPSQKKAIPRTGNITQPQLEPRTGALQSSFRAALLLPRLWLLATQHRIRQ